MSAKINVRRGDALRLDIAFTDRDTDEPLSMVGWSFDEATLTADGCAPTVVDMTFTWLNQSGGTAQVHLAATETKKLRPTETYNLNVRIVKDSTGDPHSADPVAIYVRD